MIAEMEAVKNDIKTMDDGIREVEDVLNKLLLLVPNVPPRLGPVGKTPKTML